MKLLLLRQLLVVSLAALFNASPHMVMAAEQPPAKSEAISSTAIAEDRLFNDLSTLVHEFYAKAKFTRSAGKIHFEYKARPYLNTLTGKQDIIPDFGGVIGDLEFKPGAYRGKVKLPQQYSEYAFYSVILMAPYVESSNVHIYTRLAYPSDTLHDFTDRFQDIVNSFAEGSPPALVEETKPEETVSKSQIPAPQAETKAPDGRPSNPFDLPSSPRTVKAPSAVESVDQRKISFWKATKGQTTAYVFPTINFGRNRYFSISGEVGKAFNLSKILAVDSYLGLPSDPYSMGCYTGEDRLTKHLSTHTHRLLNELVAWTGEPIEIYDIWKPYFFCTGFDSSLIRQVGYNSLDLERQLVSEARFADKKMMELEPAVSRLNYFDSLSDDVKDLCARLALYDVLDYEVMQSRTEDAWLAADPQKILTAIMSSTRKHPEVLPAYERLYQECNSPLVSALDGALQKSTPIFVSLDIRRVLGDKGILKLLENEGYQVQQLSGLPPTPEAGVARELPYIDTYDTP